MSLQSMSFPSTTNRTRPANGSVSQRVVLPHRLLWTSNRLLLPTLFRCDLAILPLPTQQDFPLHDQKVCLASLPPCRPNVPILFYPHNPLCALSNARSLAQSLFLNPACNHRIRLVNLRPLTFAPL